MKKLLLGIGICFFVAGCASSVVTKNLRVIADPPDSLIRVVSGPELKEERFSSPAAITIEVPDNPALAARAFLEVSRDQYKPTTISLRHINEGDTLKIKLEKIIAFQMKYRLLAPALSDELKFQDHLVAASFVVGENTFQVGIMNLTTYPLTIHWQSAQYTDIFGRQHRLMHSKVPYADRNNAIPDQIVLHGKALLETVTPIENISVSAQTRGYVVKPLFPFARDGAAAFKGKTFNLFLPIEINRQIIPYNFKFEIMGALK